MATTVNKTPEDTHSDYCLLNKESAELRDLIQQIRTEANLLPMFKAKRPLTAVSGGEDQEEESPKTKQARISKEPENNKINDRDELMARLSSFSFLFQYIPRPVSALDCAKHGWKDTKSVTKEDGNICVLSCDTCKNNMFVIDCDYKKCDPQKANDIRGKYEAGLYNCHKEDCLWRHRKCEDRVYNFPLSSISEGLERLDLEAKKFISARESKKELFPMTQHEMDNQMLSKVEYFAKRAKNQLEQTKTNNSTAAEADAEEGIDQQQNPITTLAEIESAYILSLYGWQLLDPSIPGVKCELCFSKKAFYQIKKSESFNVLEEHKTYCPWKNPDTADAYTPRGFSTISRNKKLSGSEWMQQVISLEYGLLVKKADLSLSSRELVDEKLYNLKQKMYRSYDLLNSWKSHIEEK